MFTSRPVPGPLTLTVSCLALLVFPAFGQPVSLVKDINGTVLTDVAVSPSQGGLVGKAVTVDYDSGASFDSAMTYKPR